MKYFIFTTKDREVESNRTYNRLLELNINKDDIIIEYGFKPSDVPFLKKDFHTPHYRFIKYTVKNMIDTNDDCVYIEDNVYPLKRVEDISINPQNINWLGYIFNHKDYICGCKYIYYPLEVLKQFPTKVRYQHIDRWIRNYALKHNILTINENYIKLYRYESCWGTQEQKRKKQQLKEKLFID